jgi:TonB family protein
MAYSLSPPAPPARAPERGTPRSRGTLDVSLSTRLGDTGTTPDARIGSDWGNELIAWVNRRKYYPPQAAMQGEDGEVTVRATVTPNGRVTSVELTRRSGSRWLDMALLALFRDQTVPPPRGEKEPITFNFTMRYILLRGP